MHTTDERREVGAGGEIVGMGRVAPGGLEFDAVKGAVGTGFARPRRRGELDRRAVGQRRGHLMDPGVGTEGPQRPGQPVRIGVGSVGIGRPVALRGREVDRNTLYGRTSGVVDPHDQRSASGDPAVPSWSSPDVTSRATGTWSTTTEAVALRLSKRAVSVPDPSRSRSPRRSCRP